MYEDPGVELRAFPDGAPVFCIASAGDTALALASRHPVTAVDINPVQLDVRDGPPRPVHRPRVGSAERLLSLRARPAAARRLAPTRPRDLPRLRRGGAAARLLEGAARHPAFPDRARRAPLRHRSALGLRIALSPGPPEPFRSGDAGPDGAVLRPAPERLEPLGPRAAARGDAGRRASSRRIPSTSSAPTPRPTSSPASRGATAGSPSPTCSTERRRNTGNGCSRPSTGRRGRTRCGSFAASASLPAPAPRTSPTTTARCSGEWSRCSACGRAQMVRDNAGVRGSGTCCK